MSSYRSYVPWNKSGLSSSYSSSRSSGSRTYGTGKLSESGISSSTCQYDGGGGSGRRLGTGGDASTTGRNNYSSGFSYRSPYLGPNYSRSSTGSYLSSSKDNVTRSATTSSSSAATERMDKENERLSLRDRYSSGTYPGRSRDSSYSSKDKEDAGTGSSHRALGRSVTANLSTDSSPEKTLTSAEVGTKADRVGYGSSMSPYRLYTRTYSRSTSRDSAPDVSSSTSTTAATPGHTTSSLRYGCSSRYGSNIIRSPVNEKPPTVFGLSSLGYSRRSISRSNSLQDSEEPKKSEVKPVSTAATSAISEVDTNSQEAKSLENKGKNEKTEEEEEEEVTLTTFITIVTRGTSPTPPSATSYVRTRRTDLARVIEKTIEKRKIRPEMLDKGTQSDPGENTARLSRYGVSSRWSAYLDRYPGAASSYSPVSRYSSRYSYSSSRSDDKETAVKSSADQETCYGTSTSEAPKTTSSTVIVNNDVAKGTILPGRKLNSSPLDSSERKTDSDISSIQQSEIVGDKPNETCVEVTKCVAGNEIPSDVSIIGRDESKQTACAKTKTFSGKEERKSEFLKENKGMAKETELECLTRGQIVKNISGKYSVQNTGTTPKSSRTNSTVDSSSITPSDGTHSKVSSDSKIEGVGSAQVPCVTSSSINFPAVTDMRQEDKVISGIKSRNTSSVTLSMEDVSDKTSSCEENKATSDTAAGSSNTTKTIPFKNTSVRSSTQIGTVDPLGMKSKSSSAASLSSEEGSIKTSSVETSISSTASERGREVLGLVRKKSLKNVPAKHSEPPHTDSVACMISNSASPVGPFPEASTDKTSLFEGILGGTPNEDGSRTNISCKQARSSTSISKEEALTKTSLSPTLRSKTLSDTPTSKLPPPVPKSDSNAQGLKSSSSLHSLNKFSAANKDFRKSSLNVELPDNVQAEAFKKMQEKQRHARTFERKIKRSNSASSGDAEKSCPDAVSTLSLPTEENSNSPSLGTSRSPFRLHFSSSTSKLPSGTTENNIAVPKPQGSDRTKATPNLIKAYCEPLRDTIGAKRIDSRGSGTDISSTETSSSSGSSCSDEEDEGLIINSQNSTNLEHRTQISPTGRDSQQISATSAIKNSNSDELSVSADKLPRPPVSPRPSKTEESKSFFMRALAPVTNLFKGKQESNKSVGLQRTGSAQSLSKSEKEGVEVKKMGALEEHSSQISVLDRKRETDTGSEINDENDSIKFSLKYKIRKQESGERAWWMDSNSNIPEGIKRIESSTSIKEHKDRESDGGTAVGVQKVFSNDSVNILQEENSSNIDNTKKMKYKVSNETYDQFEELPGLDKKSDEILEEVNQIRSKTSVNKIEGDEKGEVNTDGTEGAQKKSALLSSQKNKNSEIDTAINQEGVEKNVGKLFRLRHQQSGELPWWLDSCASIPEGVKRIQSNASINKLPGCDTEDRSYDSNYTDKSVGLQKTPSNMSLDKCKKSHYDTGKPSVEEEKSKTKLHRLRHQQSGELPWWLDNSAPVPEGVLRIQSSSAVNKLQDSEGEKSAEGVQRTTRNASLNKPRESDGESKTTQGVQRMRSNSSVNKLQSSDSDSKKSGEGEVVKKKIHKVRHQESGELSFRLSKSTSKSDGIQSISSSQSVNNMQATEHKEEETSNRKFPYKLRHQESGEKAWWLGSRGDIPEGIARLDSNQSLSEELKSGKGKQDREESSPTDTSEEDFNESIQEKENVSGNLVPKFPLVLPAATLPGRTLQLNEESGRRSPYDNLQEPGQKTVKNQASKPKPKNLPLFIGSHTNIDDILGTAATLVNPVMGLSRLRKKLEGRDAGSSNEEESSADSSDCEEIDPGQVRIHDSTAKTPHIQRIRNVTDEKGRRPSSGMIKLDDTALQLYKDGDYGSYLDLEASINEQQEEFDGFQTNRKNSIVLRTQLSVRVHTIIEKLLNSEGRELRRALFSLKQIFQEDKDLVHEFVQNDGLACLIKVGSEADQNYQNYILRALGQVMLYVDGMNGVMEHNETVQWLYALIASKFRLVVKTALKLLLVFIEYVETNCLLLIKAVHAVDTAHGLLPWNNIVKLLKDYDAADTELLIYAMTLVNKTLNGIPDQDTYYDQVDALEEQGIEGTIQRYMSKQGTDLDLLRQFQIYEAVLHHEDGEEKGTPLKQLDETVRKTLRNRKSLSESLTTERRKSRRHSTGTSPMSSSFSGSGRLNSSSLQTSTVADDESESSSSRSSPVPEINGSYKESKAGDAGVTPALRRRRERAERQRSFIREQQETAATLKATLGSPDERVADENQRLCKRLGNGTFDNGDSHSSNKLQQVNRSASRKDLTPLMNAVNKLQDATSGAETLEGNGILKKPWVLSMMYGKNSAEEVCEDTPLVGENEQDDSAATSERKKILQLKRENTVKDLTQKLSSQNIIHSPVEDGNNKSINRIGDMTGLISKAKEGLAKSKSKQDVVKSPTSDNVPKLVEAKKSETELHWEELVHCMKRPLSLCDLDFTDLRSDDEVDILSPANISNGVPPPPPPVPIVPGMPSPRGGAAPPPPPPATRFGTVAPPPMPPSVISPPLFGVSLRSQRNTPSNTSSTDTTKTPPSTPVKKTKKTVKLFWKEVRDDPIILAKLQRTGMIWDELKPVSVDTQKLEHLFESRAKDIITKKQQEMNKNKEIIVLDHKRSNAINIGMTKLPPPRSIKTAILKMDATIMNREGIEKLLTMLPTEEERSKIQEAQVANPDMPLGSAEQFLLTLASITELPARLKLWAFKLDFENSEKEIAEPLMDLKQGMETLKMNKTFRGILSTLLSVGIFLNGSEVKGFQIEYLAKVPEVKDTVHKHSLLHHLCHIVMEKFPDSSDLYSEIGAVTRASKVDFDELSANILKMEQECKASWDHLKVIAKHDGSTMKVKMSDFLADCAERIIVLSIVHRRVMNRFHKFLLWLGIPLHRVADTKPNEFCRIVSEFSLEYRTTRERVLQQLEKKANHRERNKTRGKMITEVGKFRTKEDRADAELRQLLGSDLSDAESIHGTLPWRRQRKDLGRTVLSPLAREEMVNGNLTDGDDEILESLVKTATKAPATRTTPRERKRTRHADRKSLKRSRTRENNLVEGGRESP